MKTDTANENYKAVCKLSMNVVKATQYVNECVVNGLPIQSAVACLEMAMDDLKKAYKL